MLQYDTMVPDVVGAETESTLAKVFAGFALWVANCYGSGNENNDRTQYNGFSLKVYALNSMCCHCSAES